MPDPTDFPHHIDYANSHVNAAIDQLNHALATSESRLLLNKDRRLLSTQRNNLTRIHNVLNSLIPLAQNAIDTHPPLPDLALRRQNLRTMLQKLPSPHNGQPDRSE